MVETEAQWLNSPGSPRPGSHRAALAAAPGRLDLEAAERSDAKAATLGPEATEWAQSLLEVARFELARADDKANTLFRFYGVVAALSIGLLAGSSASPPTSTPLRDSVPELATALQGVQEDAGHRLLEQLLSVSRLVHAKYALTRKALISLGVGTALCLLGIVVDALIR